MEMILTVLQILLMSTIGLFALYLVTLSIVALIAPKTLGINHAPKNRFAIVIPAYNEEKSLPNTLESLLSVNYPDHLYEVVVIADNCTDNTPEVAYNKGVTVYERHNTNKRGKGYALKWGFNKIMKSDKHYDAAVVVDADSIVTPNLLKIMNSNLEEGAEVIQGYLTVEPKPGVWSNEMIRIGFSLYNYVRPLARQYLGLSTGLRGNGMCFSMKTLRNIPWNAFSLAEDMEYTMDLILNDYEVVFAPEALGIALMPETFESAESQRERWEMGRYPIIKDYGLSLLFGAFKKRSMVILDTLIDLVLPPLANLAAISGFMVTVNAAAYMAGYTLGWSFMGIWFIILGLLLLHVILGLHASGVDRSIFRAFVRIPYYILWKMKVYLKILIQGTTRSWIRTDR